MTLWLILAAFVIAEVFAWTLALSLAATVKRADEEREQ